MAVHFYRSISKPISPLLGCSLRHRSFFLFIGGIMNRKTRVVPEDDYKQAHVYCSTCRCYRRPNIYKSSPWFHLFFLPIWRLRSSSVATFLEARCSQCDHIMQIRCPKCQRPYGPDEKFCPYDGAKRP